MYSKDLKRYQEDICAGKRALPSYEEIRRIEKRCEQAHDDAVWSVISAPFMALRDILSYSGQANQQVTGTV